MDRRTFLKKSWYLGATALLASYPFFIERNLVQVNHYLIPVPGLPRSFQGFRVVHLTDLHQGLLVSEEFIRGVIDTANRSNPDIIVCTGDYVHGQESAKTVDAVWRLLQGLTAPQGVYSVLGNHDHWADTQRSLYWLERSGQNLRHTCKPIYRGKERIVIGGAGDFLEDSLLIDKSFACSDEGDCRILLTHNPDSVDTPFSTPVSLILSGHTHGGQISLPIIGPPILPVQNKRYSSGLIPTHKGKMFISKGIGWSLYPVRFNCYPEIAVHTLTTA